MINHPQYGQIPNPENTNTTPSQSSWMPAIFTTITQSVASSLTDFAISSHNLVTVSIPHFAAYIAASALGGTSQALGYTENDIGNSLGILLQHITLPNIIRFMDSYGPNLPDNMFNILNSVRHDLLIDKAVDLLENPNTLAHDIAMFLHNHGGHLTPAEHSAIQAHQLLLDNNTTAAQIATFLQQYGVHLTQTKFLEMQAHQLRLDSNTISVQIATFLQQHSASLPMAYVTPQGIIVDIRTQLQQRQQILAAQGK